MLARFPLSLLAMADSAGVKPFHATGAFISAFLKSDGKKHGISSNRRAKVVESDAWKWSPARYGLILATLVGR